MRHLAVGVAADQSVEVACWGPEAGPVTGSPVGAHCGRRGADRGRNAVEGTMAEGAQGSLQAEHTPFASDAFSGAAPAGPGAGPESSAAPVPSGAAVVGNRRRPHSGASIPRTWRCFAHTRLRT